MRNLGPEQCTNATVRRLSGPGRDAWDEGVGGMILRLPLVGDSLVIYHADDRRLVTSPVRSILLDADSEALFISTDNSVYRLVMHGELPCERRAA